jgi:hypothetical protein
MSLEMDLVKTVRTMPFAKIFIACLLVYSLLRTLSHLLIPLVIHVFAHLLIKALFCYLKLQPDDLRVIAARCMS